MGHKMKEGEVLSTAARWTADLALSFLVAESEGTRLAKLVLLKSGTTWGICPKHTLRFLPRLGIEAKLGILTESWAHPHRHQTRRGCCPQTASRRQLGVPGGKSVGGAGFRALCRAAGKGRKHPAAAPGPPPLQQGHVWTLQRSAGRVASRDRTKGLPGVGRAVGQEDRPREEAGGGRSLGSCQRRGHASISPPPSGTVRPDGGTGPHLAAQGRLRPGRGRGRGLRPAGARRGGGRTHGLLGMWGYRGHVQASGPGAT